MIVENLLLLLLLKYSFKKAHKYYYFLADTKKDKAMHQNKKHQYEKAYFE